MLPPPPLHHLSIDRWWGVTLQEVVFKRKYQKKNKRNRHIKTNFI